MKLKFFFCQFPNPWTLRVSGMGGYTSKCEKKSKSLHPNVRAEQLPISHVVFVYITQFTAALAVCVYLTVLDNTQFYFRVLS